TGRRRRSRRWIGEYVRQQRFGSGERQARGERQYGARQKNTAPHCRPSGKSTGCSINRCGSLPPSYQTRARNRNKSASNAIRNFVRRIATNRNPSQTCTAVSAAMAAAAMTIEASALSDSEIKSLAGRIDRPLALVGMMGAGKSTVGRKLAQLLDLPFVDADDE